MSHPKYIIIGAALLDILARPVSREVFRTGSLPAENIRMTTGGDAMNEAAVLASLGADVRLVSKLGLDPAAEVILSRCRELGIDTEYIVRTGQMPTSINLVLVDEKGERHFITSPEGTLRRYYPEDISRDALEKGDILCFASIFVAPAFTNRVLKEFFAEARGRGLLLCADMTKRKNGETIEDMRESLSYLDYVFPNYAEASLLTGLTDWEDIASAILDCGVRHVILKAGARGCFIKTAETSFWVPACRGVQCVDTTGAGDTFAACFLYALGRGYSLEECGKFANAGASLCVEQVGSLGKGMSLEQILQRMDRI